MPEEKMNYGNAPMNKVGLSKGESIPPSTISSSMKRLDVSKLNILSSIARLEEILFTITGAKLSLPSQASLDGDSIAHALGNASIDFEIIAERLADINANFSEILVGRE